MQPPFDPRLIWLPLLQSSSDPLSDSFYWPRRVSCSPAGSVHSAPGSVCDGRQNEPAELAGIRRVPVRNLAARRAQSAQLQT